MIVSRAFYSHVKGSDKCEYGIFYVKWSKRNHYKQRTMYLIKFVFAFKKFSAVWANEVLVNSISLHDIINEK